MVLTQMKIRYAFTKQPRPDGRGIEPLMRIELMTSFLPRMRSTPELQRLTNPIVNRLALAPLREPTKTNQVGQAGLEPAKALRQRSYSPPPLPLGTLTLVNCQACDLAAPTGVGLRNCVCTEPRLSVEPTKGLEPLTCRLQNGCSAN